MRGALRSGANVLKDEAKANVPVASGALRDGLKVSTRSKGGTVKAILRATGIHGYIAMWVEFGTRPHLIKVQESEKPINVRLSDKRGVLVRASMTTINRNVLKIGNTFVGPTVSHPGSNPRPFMRPALDARAQDAVIASAEYMKKRLSDKYGLDTSDVIIEGDE